MKKLILTAVVMLASVASYAQHAVGSPDFVTQKIFIL